MAESTKEGKRLIVRQIRSGTGFEESQKRTLKALGLGKLHRTVDLPDNPAVRGMTQKVIHLVEVTEAVGTGSAASDAPAAGAE